MSAWASKIRKHVSCQVLEPFRNLHPTWICIPCRLYTRNSDSISKIIQKILLVQKASKSGPNSVGNPFNNPWWIYYTSQLRCSKNSTQMSSFGLYSNDSMHDSRSGVQPQWRVDNTLGLYFVFSSFAFLGLCSCWLFSIFVCASRVIFGVWTLAFCPLHLEPCLTAFATAWILNHLELS